MNIKRYEILDETELNSVAQDILHNAKYKLFLFKGDLGAGKTTLIKNILEHLHIQDEASSPSYAIINEYLTDNDESVYHIDLYRLDNAEEAFNLGLEEYLYSGNYCFMEWPQLFIDYLDADYHIIEIEVSEDGKRHISFS